MRRLVLLLVLVGPTCTRHTDDPRTDLWLAPVDAQRPEASIPDLSLPDCPSGVDAGATGWHVAARFKQPLYGVSCVAGHLFVAGGQGTLLHRGAQAARCGPFEVQTVPTQADLLTVTFADSTYGVTAGRASEVWETRNLGQTWSIAPQCGDVKFDVFHALHLYSPSKGFGAGATQSSGAYKIFAGKTWICPNQTFAQQVFLGTFRLVDRCWLVGDTTGRVYHTPDEAVTWFYTDLAVTKPMRDVFFTSAMIGIIVGDEGTILRSDDGAGMGWNQVTTLGTDDLTAVFFIDDQLGWAVGDNGAILHSTDAGQSWSYQVAPTTERLEGVCFTSATEGWAVGQGGTVLYTTTGGQ